MLLGGGLAKLTETDRALDVREHLRPRLHITLRHLLLLHLLSTRLNLLLDLSQRRLDVLEIHAPRALCTPETCHYLGSASNK